MAGVPLGVRTAEVRERYKKILKKAAEITGCSEGTTSILIIEWDFVTCPRQGVCIYLRLK